MYRYTHIIYNIHILGATLISRVRLFATHPAAVRCDMVLHRAVRARDMYKQLALTVRCDMVLHRAFRARHLRTNM